jgi:hypothetical protein
MCCVLIVFCCKHLLTNKCTYTPMSPPPPHFHFSTEMGHREPMSTTAMETITISVILISYVTMFTMNLNICE